MPEAGLKPPPAKGAGGDPRLDAYVQLLLSWGRVHNLTGASDELELRELIADCAPLVEAAAMTSGPLCDVGAGAGMPGVMLALAAPGRSVTLVESEASKCAFLEQVRITLGLDNMVVVHGRSESWRPARPPAVICARAVASLPRIIAGCAALIEPGTIVLALKPKDPAAEIAALVEGGRWRLLGQDALAGAPSRHLVRLEARR